MLQPDVDPESETGGALLRQSRAQRHLLVLEVPLLPREAGQLLQPLRPVLPRLPLLPNVTVLLTAVNTVGPVTANNQLYRTF